MVNNGDKNKHLLFTYVEFEHGLIMVNKLWLIATNHVIGYAFTYPYH